MTELLMTNPRARTPAIDTIMVSKLDLRYPPCNGTREVIFRLPPLTNPKCLFSILSNLWRAKSASVIFISNPAKEELIFICLAKALYRSRLKTFVFDLIMQDTGVRNGQLLVRLKRRLLRAVDVFIFIHKDTDGYERSYGIPRSRCQYVPFKANNFDLANEVVGKDGDYVVSLGASQRDYKLLIDAIGGSSIPLKIILPEMSVRAHRAHMGYEILPQNVQHVKTPVDRLSWSRYIAESRLVVIPILPGVIQPAGISVYLEAMILAKPVVITRGASTEGILHEDLAVIVPPGNVQALREAVTSVWNDSTLRQRLAENGRRYAMSLGDHQRLLADLRAAIRRQCSPRGSAPPPE
jgi:glycosyltransferase involved in cell wall biosynthesis